ncbi:hypothetical protein BK126_26290 [Paenibacillus sp. FSL H7-0326]|uniref:ribbon-helix-helix protein, CopG family n=1 Tax=Paenibacillus sp. FSL H7-0326 TaxID=1921144 RepID=UPI00096DCFCB|nr:ribbon-helix-helix protein, CopG family [Paenibacillus sp. FSL H7-0326]OMC63705.1 hypothetical protein BK126_26290 [Paenibacillus sp. FSL H7-0326]
MGETQQRVQVLFDDDLLKSLDAECKKQGMNRSEFIRSAVEQRISSNSAEQGLDTILKMLRKVLQDELNPQFNRLAKMQAKTTKAAATAMYMQLVTVSALGLDGRDSLKSAEEKAVGYLTNKES